ncbi:MAG: hypothetical protein KDD94_08540 [Calditrichaeota bacterium]|nr:hypothetical protein [Calditrichota bacterium]
MRLFRLSGLAEKAMQVDKKQFGDELRKLILKKGYNSIYDFHKQSAHKHISYSSLKDTISGRVIASVPNLVLIAEALDMKPKDFFAVFSFKRIG